MDAASPPLVSILIRSMERPVLQRAIASAAAQTWPNLEIVVIAACGQHHGALPEQVNGRPLRLIKPDPDARLPRAEAANLALESARGEWLNFLDDDDELLPQHLSTLLGAERQPDQRVIYARTSVVDAAGNITGHCGVPGHPLRYYYENLSTPNGTLFHRSLVDEGLRFDTCFSIYEDYDFFIHCASRSRLLFVDEETSIWHAHEGESGLGHGANSGTTLRAELNEALTRKWAGQFDRWASEPGALLLTGQQLLKRGETGAACHALERALHQQPGDINALNLAGMANLQARNFERAEVLLREAVRLLPKHPALQENLALILRQRAEARLG